MVIQISDRIVNIVHYYVVHRLIAMDGIMYFGTITGSLERIFTGYSGQKPYKKTLDKAGALLYAIVHGHSFSDGNKRTGLLTTYLFLMYNGYALFVPEKTTKFLERMADALDPDAPTEEDAIRWVHRNARTSVGPKIISASLTFYCRIWGTRLLEAMTKNILEQNALPGIDKEKLIDRSLKKPNSPAITCAEDQ